MWLCLGFLVACGAPPDVEEGRELGRVRQALAADVSPSTVDFGEVRVGVSVSKTLTVRNTGTKNLTVTSLSVSKASFSVSGSPPFTLPPASTRTLTVVFSPTTEGTDTGTLVIKTDDTETPELTASLLGRGVKPQLVVDPTSIVFGDQRVGTQSTPLIARVRNVGSGTVTLTSLSLNAPFSLASSGTPPFTLPPGTSQDLPVVFSPTTEGPVSGNLTLQTDDPVVASVVVSLTGKGTRSKIAVSPASVAFGAQRVSTTQSRIISVTNEGSASLRVSFVSTSGSPDFSAPSPSFELPPGAYRELTVSFTPTVEGNLQATLKLETDDPGSPSFTVPLSGTGVRPKLVVTPDPLDFGPQGVGTSTTRTLTLSNTGTGPLTFLSASFEGGGPNDFFLEGVTFPVTLPPQQVLSVAVRFKPSIQGIVSKVLEFRTNDPDLFAPKVSVSGTGVRPRIEVNPMAIDFGTQGVGTTSAQVMVLRNTGLSTLLISSISLTGPDAGAFTLEGVTLPMALEPSQTRAVTVRFTPVVGGKATATLQVNSNDEETPVVTVSLTGRAEVPALEVSVSALAFGDQRVGTISEPRTLLVRNTGTGSLKITGVSVSQRAFTLSSTAPFELAPAETRALSVSFAPTTVGPVTAELTLKSNDVSRPTTPVALSGTGTDSQLSVSATAVDFGAQRVGTPVVREVVVSNTGGSVLKVSTIAINAGTPFTVTPNAPFELAPGASQDLSVTFTPPSAGDFTASLTVVTDATSMPEATVSLAGKGEQPKAQEPDDEEEQARGCASTGGTAGLALLSLLGLARRRRE